MTHRRKGNVTRKAGFTLIEVLLAVALSSIILVALFGMFSAVLDVASWVKDHEAGSYGQRVFESILFDDLRSAFRATGANYRFDGNSGGFLGAEGVVLSFCTSATLTRPSGTDSLTLQRVEYVLKDGEGESKTLVRREKSSCGLKGEWEWIEVPIVKGISGLEVEYIDDEGGSFVTEWNNPVRFPRVVKMRVSYVDKREFVFNTDLSFMATGKVSP